jgi:hypothetical protein
VTIKPSDINQTAIGAGTSCTGNYKKSDVSYIDTSDRVTLGKSEPENRLLNPTELTKMVKAETPDESTTVITNTEKISIKLPFEKHLQNAAVFILEKTNAQYPGFSKNADGMSRKGLQISSHLNDFTQYLKENSSGDMADLPDKERKSLVEKATGFVADKIGEESGMLPHMRKNPIFLSPIRSNISDYLEYLNKENIVISADEKGNLTATKFYDKKEAMDALAGNSDSGAEKKTVDFEKGLVIIGGVKLKVNS